MTDEQRAQRIHHHMYETNEGIAEHAERIVALEELVTDLYEFIDLSSEYGTTHEIYSCGDFCKHAMADDRCHKTGECWYERKMKELGIEVTHE